MRKLTYEYIKKQVEKEGCKLLSTNYINASKKLKIQCSKGHEYKIKWNSFQQGKRCIICNSNNLRKLKFSIVKHYIETKGYILISNIYKDNQTKLILKCSNNHKFFISWSSFQQGHRCPECYGNKRLTIKYVKEQVPILQKGYKLLSTEYINNYTKLKFKCKKGHIYEATWDCFSHGFRCPKCYYKSLIKDYTVEELNELNKYRKCVINLSNRNYKKYKNIINPDNLERGRNKYHLDHKFSIIEGFRRNIPVKYIASPCNLQMLIEKENIIKYDKCDQNEKKLYIKYIEFNLKGI